MLNRRYIANHHLFGENRLPTRTLLVPAQKRDITWKNLAGSNRIQLLNGTWKFSYLPEDSSAMDASENPREVKRSSSIMGAETCKS